MSKVFLRTVALSAVALGLASPALAQRTVSGGVDGLQWTATNRIVGQTGTGTAAAVPPGNPIYNAPMPLRSGVAALIMDYGAGGSFICTGSLISPTRILTAGHCVSGGTRFGGTSGLKSVTAHFYAGSNPGQPGNVYNPDVVTSNPSSPFGSPATVSILSNGVSVHTGYTGEVIDQNDIAVVALSEAAPLWAQVYGIDYSPDLTSRDFTVTGYGGRSSTGGNVGADLGTGRLREGDNMYDFRLGDSRFNGAWTSILGGTAQYDFSYLSDFDNGIAANDTACRVSQASNFGGGPGLDFCNLGRGAREVGVAGGDSGGPQFGADGRLLSVTSYGLTFGTGFGDFAAGLNSSWGEFNGFVPLHIHQDFIRNAVPEPATWAMMIMGFGLAGAGMRARSRKVIYA
jgi:hypothetical protein